MALILREFVKGYKFIFNDLRNPMVDDWFLMSSPWPGLAILAAYFYFIKELGPRLMEGHAPFKLYRLMQVYNLFQIGASAFIVYKGVRHGYGKHYSFRCEPIDWSDDPDSVQMSSMMHMYFVVKVIDLLDTVFFVLRKKQNQVTFLHVYHHAGMVALAWGATKWYSNGHCTLLAILNSTVHTVMYGYYFLTSASEKYKRDIWWKKYITQMQIIQFLWLAIHFGQLIFHNPCNFPNIGLIIVLPQNVFMLILFCDFYRKAYLMPKKKTS